MIKGIVPQLAEAGKIKIGGLGEPRLKKAAKNKPKNQLSPRDFWRPPIKLDHFLITRTERRDGKLVEDTAAMEACPRGPDGKITEIPIVVHSDELEEVFPTCYALYSGRKLACKGDGELATRWAFDKETRKRLDETTQVPCPCKYLDAARCKAHGTLHCSLALPDRAVAGAVHKWRTTSIISIRRMMGSITQILATVGTLKGLPLWLRLEPVDTDNGRVYCCHLELRAADVMGLQRTALEAAQMRAQLTSGTTAMIRGYRAMIEGPEDERAEEQAEVAQEFHGDQGDAEPEIMPSKPAPQVEVDADGDLVDGKTGEVVGKASETNEKLKNMVGNAPKAATTGRKTIKTEQKPDEPPPPSDDDNPDYGGPEGDLPEVEL